jgi:hypothetical protein
VPTADPPIYVEGVLDMRAENTETSAGRVLINHASGTSSSSQQPYSLKRVTPGTMTHGDFKKPTPWSYDLREERFVSGRIDGFWPTDSVLRTTQLGPWVNSTTDAARMSVDNSRITSAYNLALERLNGKVRGTLDLSVAAAELGSTRRMLNATEGLTRTIEGFRQRKLAVVKRVSREVSGRYLEWRYGWQPLLSDIYEAADESQRYVANKVQDIRATATLKYPELTGKVFSAEGVNFPTQVKTQGKTSVAIELRFKTAQDRLDRWASLNPVSIAWELLPYSFVADWFYNVGDYLRGMETGFLYKDNFVDGYVSTLNACIYDAKIDANLKPGTTRYIYNGSYMLRYVRFERSLLSSYPLPRLPSWNAKLGSQRLLSAAALLEQFLNHDSQKEPSTPRRRSARQGQGKSYWEKRASDLLLRHGLVR